VNPAQVVKGSTAANFTVTGSVSAGGGAAFYGKILEGGATPHLIFVGSVLVIMHFDAEARLKGPRQGSIYVFGGR
jgi:hypothetical protein